MQIEKYRNEVNKTETTESKIVSQEILSKIRISALSELECQILKKNNSRAGEYTYLYKDIIPSAIQQFQKSELEIAKIELKDVPVSKLYGLLKYYIGKHKLGIRIRLFRKGIILQKERY